MGKTKIDWCDQVLNPFVGCSKCSPGCQSCYAEKFASMLANNRNFKIYKKYLDVVDGFGNWTGKISDLDLSCFDKLPKKPSRVFVGSMTDLFHENVPYDYQMKVLDKIKEYPQHTFLLLTKRITRAQGQYINWDYFYSFPENVWLGVTVCNQEEADKKIPVLLQIPAAKHFVSIEPMLGPVDISEYAVFCDACPRKGMAICVGKPGSGEDKCVGLDWVMAGGETGPNARPMSEKWVKSLRDQCLDTGMPFFFKSWGEWCSYQQLPENFDISKYLNDIPQGYWDDTLKEKVILVGKKRSGYLIDGVEYRQFPDV